MKIFYLKRILIGILLLAVLVIAVIYTWSEVIINKTYDVPMAKIRIPTDTASVREGERLVRIEHCGDCHGENYTGDVFEKIDRIAQFVAPNITAIIPDYSNEELERLIRFGIKRNGKSVFIMPCGAYNGLRSESLAQMIAYLRTLKRKPASPGLPGGTIYYPSGRMELIKGNILPMASIIINHPLKPFNKYDTSQIGFGKYLAITGCTSCHGRELKGNSFLGSPNLIIAAAYTEDQFIHLLKTGEGGLGRKDLGLMSYIAKNHLSYLNDKEMNAIYAFLKKRSMQKE